MRRATAMGIAVRSARIWAEFPELAVQLSLVVARFE